jgi:hypothetical protein
MAADIAAIRALLESALATKKAKTAAAAEWTPAVGRLLDVWNECRGLLPEAMAASPGTKRYKQAVAALKVEPDLSRWRLAIKALAASPWHRGENPAGIKYGTIDFLLQSGKFMEWLDKGRDMAKSSTKAAPVPFCATCKTAVAIYGPGTRNQTASELPACGGCFHE